MKALQEQQVQGNKGEMIPANKDDKWEIRKDEEHLMHVSLQIPGYDQRTGKPQHKPFLQKFYVDQFNRMNKDDAFKGYESKIVHDPRTKEQIADDVSDDAKKPVSRMNKEELRALYKELYGEDAADDLTNDQLRVGIEDKQKEAGAQ